MKAQIISTKLTTTLEGVELKSFAILVQRRKLWVDASMEGVVFDEVAKSATFDHTQFSYVAKTNENGTYLKLMPLFLLTQSQF